MSGSATAAQRAGRESGELTQPPRSTSAQAKKAATSSQNNAYQSHHMVSLADEARSSHAMKAPMAIASKAKNRQLIRRKRSSSFNLSFMRSSNVAMCYSAVTGAA